MTFNPTGSLLATAGRDKRAVIWLHGMQRAHKRLRHESPVLHVTFSPDGVLLVTVSTDDVARVWDSIGGAELFRLPQEGLQVRSAFSPDGATIATAGLSDVTLWSTTNGREVGRLAHGGLVGDADKTVRCVTFSADGTKIAIAGGSARKGYAAVWASS